MQTHSGKVNIDQSRWIVSSQPPSRLARMPMPHVAPPQPAPDAAVIRTGRRRLRKLLPAVLPFLALGVAGLVALVMLITGTTRGEFSVAGLLGVLLLLVFGAFGVLFAISGWQERRTMVVVDSLGVWLDTGRARQVIPWTQLREAGIWWSRVGRKKARLYSVELVPAGPVAERDPVLWTLVRDEASPGPGPRGPRYRLPVPASCHEQVTEAVLHYCPPQLWAGVEERPQGHLGRPDRNLRPRG